MLFRGRLSAIIMVGGLFDNVSLTEDGLTDGDSFIWNLAFRGYFYF